MQRDSLKDRAYTIIKEKIVSCEYAPATFLVESELMNQVGASRTPIREALNKLEQENLVRILPKRGVLVCEITMGTVNEIYEVRGLIEPYIIRNYAHTLAHEALERERERIVSCADLPASTAGYAVDNDLHQLLINASGNAYFNDIMNKIYTQNHRIRILSGRNVKNRNEETRLEHIRIFDLLLEGDIEAAAQAMYTHLENSKKAAVNAMLAGGSMAFSR